MTRRPLQTALIDEYERPVGPMLQSVVHGTNADLIAAIAPLYLRGSVLDVTYGLGVWWRRFQPERFAYHDLALDGVDFRELPYPAASWDTVCFDPPYIPSRAPSTSTKRAISHRAAYGLNEPRTRAEMDALIAAGLAECARVSCSWVLMKCGDWGENATTGLRLGHVSAIVAGERAGLRVHDLIVHATRPGPSNNNLREISRARRAHSYLLVFGHVKVSRGTTTDAERPSPESAVARPGGSG